MKKYVFNLTLLLFMASCGSTVNNAEENEINDKEQEKSSLVYSINTNLKIGSSDKWTDGYYQIECDSIGQVTVYSHTANQSQKYLHYFFNIKEVSFGAESINEKSWISVTSRKESKRPIKEWFPPKGQGSDSSWQIMMRVEPLTLARKTRSLLFDLSKLY